MRKVTFEVFEDDGYWWAKLVEHGTPVPEGALPNLGQALSWGGPTPEAAEAKARSFLANAARVVQP